jgi:chromosome segregation ATPase
MNRKGAVLKLSLIITIAISLALIGSLAFLYNSEIAKNIKLRAQVDELTARERIAEDKLEASKKKVSELTLKLQETKDRITTLTEELDKEKSSRQEAIKELEQVKADMEQQKASRQDIENMLAQAQNAGRRLKEQLKVIEQQRSELEVKIKNLESGAGGVELGKVVVNNEAADSSKVVNNAAANNANAASESVNEQAQEGSSQGKALEGKVTVVNKEYNFAVINLGQKDGVKVGDQFSVTREGKIIGDLKVEKTHESMSAAGFAAELKDTIKENDLVIQKGK